MSTRSRRTFHELVTLPDGAVPLAETALLLACEEYPQLEISPYLDKLDEIAGLVQPKLNSRNSPLETIETINDVLFGVMGFRGNTENYNDPRNSFFNDVLERRVGIPITLSAVYLEVARRVSFPIVGVGMPGHFLVKYVDRWNAVKGDGLRVDFWLRILKFHLRFKLSRQLRNAFLSRARDRLVGRDLHHVQAKAVLQGL